MTHLVDPAKIKVGQEALFACSSKTCYFKFWRRWQPTSANTPFGDMFCYAHPSRVQMFIRRVRDVQDEA